MANDDADANLVVTSSDSLVAQEVEVVEGMGKILGGEKVDAIICVAGGWAGGNSASDGKDTLAMLFFA